MGKFIIFWQATRVLDTLFDLEVSLLSLISYSLKITAFSTHVSSGAWDKTLIHRYLVKVFVTKLQLKINCFGWYAIFELTMQPPLNYSSVEVIFLWTFCHQFTFPSTKNFNLNPKLCQLILSLLSFSMSLAVISNHR